MKTTMKSILAGSLTLAVCVLGLLVQVPARATTVSECKALVDALKLETQGVTIQRNEDKHQGKLIAKLERAEIKLDQAKFSDAIQQLNDYKALVHELVTQGLMSAGDGAGLTSGADDAITCIRSLCGC